MVRDLERLLLPEYPDSENELWGSVLSSVVECANHKGERVIFENENSYELKMIGNANKSVSMIDKSNGNMWILDWTNNVFQFVKKEMPTTR